MIEFQNVNKVFRKKHEKIHALKEVSFKIDKNDIFGVIGYSGAGKSTLVRLVNQLEKATNGQVIVNGHEINTYRKKELRNIKKDIGMIFQHFNLLNSKTVFKNVAMPLILNHKSSSEIKEKVEEMLEFVGLADKKNQFPDQLSGGQKQRVAIARALVTNPKILLCDEATSALDPATTNSILHLLKNVNETFGITIMMITHEMSVIQKICNRVAVMERGEVIELGTVKDVFSHPQTKTAKSFVSTVINTEPSHNLLESFKRKDCHYTDYKLFIDEHQIKFPIINELISQYNFDINILFSSMSDIQEETVCYLWLRFNHDSNFKRDKLESYFKNHSIQFEEVH
ncbi:MULTISPECIES: methionine ABC transporter ATP-binding protein [unclassified Staphylococcus]|uniref:methionine ABC transporter ATP-binding protein n=1 Tax=unclassified Staphylococcus TaxID=91994 RepID=UPI001AEBFB97|nr:MULTISPECIES: methionine ABC transporter ATP-binding protein [unclassified Staphylococcus]